MPFGQQVARFGGDEIGFGFAGNGLGQQGLASSRRAVKQESLGRPDTQPGEGLGVFHRQLDTLFQAHLCVVEAANIFPADIRCLDHHFAHRRRLDPFQRLDKIMPVNHQFIEHFRGHGFRFQIQLGHDPADSFDRRFPGQRRQICSDKAIGCAGQFLQIDGLVERHAAGVDAEYLAPAGHVRYTDDDLAIETAGAAQGLVDRFGPVGRGDHHQIDPRFEPVHQGEQLRHQPLFGLALYLAALGRDRVNFVDEQDRRRGLGCCFEYLAELLFGLAIGRSHDFRTVDQKKLGIAFIGDCPRQPGLAGARRAMQQHPAWRIDAKPGEELRITQRQLDHLAQLVDGVVQASDIVIGHVGAAMFGRFFIFRPQLDLGILVDMDDALRHGRNNIEPDLGEGKSRSRQHLPQLWRHVAAIDLLLPVGRDKITGLQRTPHEAALESGAIALQAQVFLRGSENNLLGRLGFDLLNFDKIACTDAGIGALQAIEPDEI